MNYKDIAKRILIELAGTFSNKKSFLSSKRIERFFIFCTMLSLTIGYLLKQIFTCGISSTDFMLVIVGWLGYAGFNTIKSRQDQDKDKTDIVG